MEIKKIDLDQADSISQKEIQPLSEKIINTKVAPEKMQKTNIIPVLVAFLIVTAAGVFTGAYFKTNQVVGKSGSTSKELAGIQAQVPQTGVKVGDIYGSADEKAFKDKATGVIDKGGLNGEGSHKLVRPGGSSQTVYLTSSTIDLDTLVGHQVTVWGETFTGIKVGWLMDVGRAKIENLNVPLPN